MAKLSIRTSWHAERNMSAGKHTESDSSMDNRTCPICGGEVEPDPQNDGRWLCHTCKKRFTTEQLVVNSTAGAAGERNQEPKPGVAPGVGIWKRLERAFKNIFAMPDTAKMRNIESSGTKLSWYKALIYVLVFLMAVGALASMFDAFSKAQLSSLFGLFFHSALHICLGVAYLALASAYLVCRKRMALFTKGSGTDLSVLFVCSAVLNIVGMLSDSASLGMGSFIVSFITGAIVLVVDAMIAYANHLYFKKRSALFAFEDTELGCEPTGWEGKVDGFVDDFVGRQQAAEKQRQQTSTIPVGYAYQDADPYGNEHAEETVEEEDEATKTQMGEIPTPAEHGDNSYSEVDRRGEK